MKSVLVAIVFADVYMIVYYRLLISWHYQQQNQIQESKLGALFSFPPYAALPERGKRYARRYWMAVAVLIICVTLLTHFVRFEGLR